MRLVELGTVGKPHGYRGEFVAYTDSGRESALELASKLFVGKTPESALPYPVVSATWMPKGWKIKLEGVETDETVKSLRGHLLFANRAELPPTEEGEFYLGDLVGCTVRNADSGEDVGRCTGVESLPGVTQDRWLVEGRDGETFGVPAVRRYVDRVDVETRVIWLRNLSDLQ